jgi:hypothetical protein
MMARVRFSAPAGEVKKAKFQRRAIRLGCMPWTACENMASPSAEMTEPLRMSEPEVTRTGRNLLQSCRSTSAPGTGREWRSAQRQD